MTSRGHALAVLVLALALSGCAQMATLQGDPIERIDQYVQAGEYGKALDAIGAVRSTHPDYERARAKLPGVTRAAEAYERRMIREAQQQARDDQWQPALDTYDEALKHYPQSTALQNERERYLAAREDYLAQLRLNLLISKAQYLLNDAPVYAEIEHVIPNSYRARRDNRVHQDEIEDTADKLYTCGMDALARSDAYLAQRCLAMAHALNPSEENRAALEQAEKYKASLDTQSQAVRSRRVDRERSARAQQLVREHDKAMQSNDLLRARDALTEADRLQPGNADIAWRMTKLQKAIDRYVSEEIERGRRAYTLGQIEEALAIWQPLLRYSPDNKRLNEHIDRASRVIDNLREIEQRQPTVPLP